MGRVSFLQFKLVCIVLLLLLSGLLNYLSNHSFRSEQPFFYQTRNSWCYLTFFILFIIRARLNKNWFENFECNVSAIWNATITIEKGLPTFSYVQHGTPRSTEIQKKMPWFGTNIFWLGIPQGSQKYPFGNISCVS